MRSHGTLNGRGVACLDRGEDLSMAGRDLHQGGASPGLMERAEAELIQDLIDDVHHAGVAGEGE